MQILLRTLGPRHELQRFRTIFDFQRELGLRPKVRELVIHSTTRKAAIAARETRMAIALVPQVAELAL
jgi:hypothetical protein